jgi:hypothetical protein
MLIIIMNTCLEAPNMVIQDKKKNMSLIKDTSMLLAHPSLIIDTSDTALEKTLP